MSKIGILLINLGTPDAPDPAAVRRYLAEFLSDRRVVEIPAWAWQPILRGIILRTRPAKSARAYREVWSEQGSPLAAITRRQAEALQQRFGESVQVRHAMRYGRPAVAAELAELIAAGCNRVLAAPLYPQYCGATTASANDALFLALAGMRVQPAIRTLPPYFDDPAYIDALAQNLNRQLSALNFIPDAVLLSFHGMPERTRTLGDPYHDQCQQTGALLTERLGRKTLISFQSRFGRAKWLEPATDQLLQSLPGEGVRKLVVAAPGFSADCLETLEELGIRGREQFEAAGGERYAVLECLNDSPESLDLLEFLCRRELEGWVAAA